MADKVKNVGKVAYTTGSSLAGGAYSYEDYTTVTAESVVECGVEKTHSYVPSDGCDILLCSVELLSKKPEEKPVVSGKGCAVLTTGCHHVTDCDNCRDCAEKVHDSSISV